ncbi:unnamed protein product, partial [Schistocephalus solidus]|uniref:Peroxin/Ferlin domain-containing protein n=1 Tax=Schistocephalus solidus TaxID=70667 RepID=A0A183T6H6_SCHSO
TRWKWEAEDWEYVIQQSEDKAGWEYATSFAPDAVFTSFYRVEAVVRRRRWHRVRRFLGHDRWLLCPVSLTDLDESSAAATSAVSRRDGGRSAGILPMHLISVGGEQLPHQPLGFLAVWAITTEGHIVYSEENALSRRPHTHPTPKIRASVRVGQLADAEVSAAAGNLVYVYYVNDPASQAQAPGFHTTGDRPGRCAIGMCCDNEDKIDRKMLSLLGSAVGTGSRVPGRNMGSVDGYAICAGIAVDSTFIDAHVTDQAHEMNECAWVVRALEAAVSAVTVQTIEKDTDEDLLGDVKQRDTSVLIPELPVPLPLVEMDDGRVFEILRNLSLARRLLEEYCEFRMSRGLPSCSTMSTVCCAAAEVETVSIPDDVLHASEGLAGFGDPVGDLTVDFGAACKVAAQSKVGACGSKEVQAPLHVVFGRCIDCAVVNEEKFVDRGCGYPLVVMHPSLVEESAIHPVGDADPEAFVTVFYRTDVHRTNPEGSRWFHSRIVEPSSTICIGDGAASSDPACTPPVSDVFAVDLCVSPIGTVFVLTDDNQIYRRVGISWRQPYGTSWQLLLPALLDLVDHEQLTSISVGRRAAWVLANTGRCWFRTGLNPEDYPSTAATKTSSFRVNHWVAIPGRLKVLQSSPSDEVFAVDRASSRLLFRSGISHSTPGGEAWIPLQLPILWTLEDGLLQPEEGDSIYSNKHLPLHECIELLYTILLQFEANKSSVCHSPSAERMAANESRAEPHSESHSTSLQDKISNNSSKKLAFHLHRFVRSSTKQRPFPIHLNHLLDSFRRLVKESTDPPLPEVFSAPFPGLPPSVNCLGAGALNSCYDTVPVLWRVAGFVFISQAKIDTSKLLGPQDLRRDQPNKDNYVDIGLVHSCI